MNRRSTIQIATDEQPKQLTTRQLTARRLKVRTHSTKSQGRAAHEEAQKALPGCRTLLAAPHFAAKWLRASL